MLPGLLRCFIAHRMQGRRKHGPAEHLSSGALQGGQGRVKIRSMTGSAVSFQGWGNGPMRTAALVSSGHLHAVRWGFSTKDRVAAKARI